MAANKAKEFFTKTLGREALKYIVTRNRVMFYTQPKDIYGAEGYAMCFQMEDTIGDTVIFSEIVYRPKSKLFFFNDDHTFKTFNEVKAHYNTVADEIAVNHGRYIHL